MESCKIYVDVNARFSKDGQLIAKVTDGMVAASEDRRGKLPTRSGAVSISVSKSGKKNNSMREAAYA